MLSKLIEGAYQIFMSYDQLRALFFIYLLKIPFLFNNFYVDFVFEPRDLLMIWIMRTKVGVKAEIVDYFRNNLVSLDRFKFGEHKFFEKRLGLEPF